MAKILLISLIVSISLHFLTFNYLNKDIKVLKKKHINSSKKIMPIGYQQIKYVKLVKPKPKLKLKSKPKIKHILKSKNKPKNKSTNQSKNINKKIKYNLTKKFIKVPKKSKEKKKIVKKIIKKTISKISKNNIIKENIIKENIKKNKTLLEQLKEKDNDLKIIRKLDTQTQKYIKLYGDEYFTFSKETKKYLNNNLSNIGRVTQMYLRYPRIAVKTHQQGMNIVQFYLYPNGDISDLKISNSSGYNTLDKNTVKTIKLAYKDYPKPKQKTKIKIYVYYSLR